MLECSQVGEVRQTEAHNRTAQRQFALLHTRMAAGGVGGSKPNQRRYVQPLLWRGFSVAAILWRPHIPMPHTFVYFLLDFYLFL